MSSLLALDLLANPRGDGLHPALHRLLSDRQRIETDSGIARLPNDDTQAGPVCPISSTNAELPANVVRFPDKDFAALQTRAGR